MKGDQKEVRVACHGSDFAGANKVEWVGLSNPELEALRAASIGGNWVRVVNGRLQFAHAFDQPPGPEHDPDVGPYWPSWPDKAGDSRNIERKRRKDAGVYDPHVLVQHLAAGCGGEAKREYGKQARLLESWGFECLRSRRGPDGKYWEVWYLPSLTLADGDLEAAVKRSVEGVAWSEVDRSEKLREEAAVAFLCRHCKFGSMDVGTQRAALTFD